MEDDKCQFSVWYPLNKLMQYQSHVFCVCVHNVWLTVPYFHVEKEEGVGRNEWDGEGGQIQVVREDF